MIPIKCFKKILLNQYKKLLLFFFTEYKNEWKQHKFRRQKNKNSDFYNKNKTIFNINNINVHKILVSNKKKYGKYNSFKYFTVYNVNDIIRQLYLELSQMTGYINKFNEHKNKNKNKNTIAISLKYKYKFFLKITKKYGKKLEN